MSMSSSVSVVISAYCDGQALRLTVKSIFQQLDEKCNADLLLEVIIVDDGANQSVKNALIDLQKQYAEIVVISQNNTGLTQALIVACHATKYETIARIDVGDVMLRGRLRKQLNYLQANANAVGVATWANIVTIEGYPLYQVRHTDQEIQQSLKPRKLNSTIADDFTSPQHYTMTFRKSVYHHVGGYRPEFYFAQDVDLWLRMSEHGEIKVIEESLMSSVVTANSLSGANNEVQQNLSKLAWQATILRRRGHSEGDILSKVKLIRPTPSAVITRMAQAKSLYFIAKCLLDQDHFGAKQYFWRALKKRPLAAKNWLGFIRSLLILQNNSE